MENNNLFQGALMPITYVLRKTGEEVEMIAYNQVEPGNRSADDWVSYIDSRGKEHIKEKKTLQFDFKVGGKFANVFEKLLDFPKYEPIQLPSPLENLKYDLIKLFLNRGHTVKKSISMSKEVIDAINKDKCR